MTYYYKLPNDLYCWGQDRGGTFIPLISQIFHKFLGISAVNAVSISNYVVLILGYIGFSSLFKNNFTKILFAIIWFFPPIRFIDLTRFPLGVEYSLIGFSIYLINKIDLTKNKAWNKHFLILSTVLFLAISIWVSDLAVVSIIILLIILFVFHIIKNKTFIFSITIIFYLIFGAISSFLFINYAKSNATVITKEYINFNNWDTFIQGIEILKTKLLEVLFFQTYEYFFSLYAWLALFAIICCIIIVPKFSKLSLNSKKWLTFFSADFVVIFITILLSKWVYLNGMGRWYFIPLYISLSMIILLLIDNVPKNNFKSLIANSFLFLTVLTGGFSTIHYLKYVHPKSLRSQISVSAQFLQLGEIGIIGEFWNSYISACPDPSKIKVTSHDGYVRNPELVDAVFSQPKLYIIKDMWMDTFPDTLKQFNYSLVKKGDPFHLGNCDICRYIKIKRSEIIPYHSLKYKTGVSVSDTGITLYKDSINLKDNYVVWGPYIPIGIGDFIVKYKLKIENAEKKQPIAMFDVAVDYGKKILAKEYLNNEKLDVNENQYFEISFSTDKRYSNVEFRIYYYGNSNLNIESVKLIEQ